MSTATVSAHRARSEFVHRLLLGIGGIVLGLAVPMRPVCGSNPWRVKPG
jgi:hypothetical protein